MSFSCYYVCLTNLSNFMFGDCGHMAILFGYDGMESLDECPICKPKQPFKFKQPFKPSQPFKPNQLFTTDQGVLLCLTNPSNFMFSNCGHMTIHIEYCKAEISDKCIECDKTNWTSI